MAVAPGSYPGDARSSRAGGTQLTRRRSSAGQSRRLLNVRASVRSRATARTPKCATSSAVRAALLQRVGPRFESLVAYEQVVISLRASLALDAHSTQLSSCSAPRWRSMLTRLSCHLAPCLAGARCSLDRMTCSPAGRAPGCYPGDRWFEPSQVSRTLSSPIVNSLRRCSLNQPGVGPLATNQSKG